MKRLLFVYILFMCMLSGCSGPENPVNASWKSWDVVARKLARQFGQRYLSSGTGLLVGGGLWDYSVVDHRQMTLPEGRKLVAEMLQTTLNQTLKDPIYQEYLRSQNMPYDSEILTSKFGIKIAFWNENVDRPLFPYLAQIRAAEGKVYFYAMAQV